MAKFYFLFRGRKALLCFLFSLFLCAFLPAQRGSLVENFTEDEGLNTNYVFSFAEDNQDVLWIGTDKGLLRFDEGKWKVYDSDSGLPGNYISTVLASGDGFILHISEKGIFFFDKASGKITKQYYGLADHIVRIKRSAIDPNYAVIQQHLEGKDVFTAILLANPEKKIPLKIKSNKVFFTHQGKEKVLENWNTNFSHFALPKRKLHVKVQDGVGLVISQNGKILDTVNADNGLGSTLLMESYQSNSGDVYVGTLGNGFAVLRNLNAKTTFHLQQHKIRKIQFQDGNYYFLSNGIIYRTNPDLITTQIPVRKDALTFFIQDDILSLGTFSGIFQYKLIGDQLTELKHYPSSAGISAIGNFNSSLMSTTYGTGIQTDGNLKNQPGFPFTNIENFFSVNDGFAFVSYQSGFFTTDKNFRLKHYFSKENGLLSNQVTRVFSQNNLLYAGTKFGFSVFENEKVRRIYTHRNGFRGNMVRDIFEDRMKNIWVVSDQTIMKLKNNQLVSYGTLKTVGQHDDVILKSYYNPEKNELFIATKNRFSLVKLNELSPNRTPPLPKLLNIESNKKSLGITTDFTLERDNYETIFEFEPVYKNPVSEASLFYKINNNEWIKFEDNDRLKLSHLDVGKYKLWVKTVNSDGYESYFPNTIEIKVLNYFYHRWWFYFLSLLFVGAVVTYFLYGYNDRKFQEKLRQIAIQNELNAERQRISRDLHDNIGAYTTSLISKVDQLQNDPEDLANVNEIRDNAGQIMTLLRQTIFVLNARESSLENYLDSFLNYCFKFFKSYPHIKLKIEENIINNRMLDSTVAITIFRILQEAMQNIVKHSAATEVKIILTSDKKFTMQMIDNGKGFDVNNTQKGYGLGNMRERAMEIDYSLDIVSGDSGTVLTLREN